MFNDTQIRALEASLGKTHVKERAQAGRKFSYIEGWHAIAEANRIFGFDAWDRETVELKLLGEPREVEGKWRVAYMARVRITVRSGVDRAHSTVRDGCGYGSGIDRDLGGAHESAIKEAETDAMKRALMTFGNPFGLALYDKEQKNVVDEAEELRAQIARLKDGDEIVALMANEETQRILGDLPTPKHTEIRNYAKARLGDLGWKPKKADQPAEPEPEIRQNPEDRQPPEEKVGNGGLETHPPKPYTEKESADQLKKALADLAKVKNWDGLKAWASNLTGIRPRLTLEDNAALETEFDKAKAKHRPKR